MERKKKEAKLAARGGRRRWSGLRDTEEVGESDEKSRSRVDLEMNNDETRRDIRSRSCTGHVQVEVGNTSRYMQVEP